MEQQSVAGADVATLAMELVVVTKHTSAALLATVVRLEKRVFPKHESMADTLVKEARKTQNTLILALDARSGAVIGYILYRRSGLEGHIDKLAVAEQCRRAGVGRALMQHAVTHLQAQRGKSVGLVVDVERTGAIALYETMGFHIQSMRRDYYQPGRHALSMQRKLE